ASRATSETPQGWSRGETLTFEMKALTTTPGLRGRIPGTRIAVWAFFPTFLLFHGIVATCLPGRFDPLSTIFIVLAEWTAVAMCIRAMRLTDASIRVFWLLLAGAIFLHSVAMSLDAVTEIAGTQALNHVPAIQILFSMLSGILLIVTVSIQN